MRSVVVVLPASMWALMPMLRTFWIGVLRDMGKALLDGAGPHEKESGRPVEQGEPRAHGSGVGECEGACDLVHRSLRKGRRNFRPNEVVALAAVSRAVAAFRRPGAAPLPAAPGADRGAL